MPRKCVFSEIQRRQEDVDSLVRYDAHRGNTQNSQEVGFVQLVEQLIAYEEGQITGDEEVAFFEHLVETGTCWQLQGHYQRVAATLIEAGLINSPVHSEEANTSNA
jgi:hypothetical protein